MHVNSGLKSHRLSARGAQRDFELDQLFSSDVSRLSLNYTHRRNTGSVQFNPHASPQLRRSTKQGTLPFDKARLVEDILELTVESAWVASIVLVDHGLGNHLPVHLEALEDRYGE